MPIRFATSPAPQGRLHFAFNTGGKKYEMPWDDAVTPPSKIQMLDYAQQEEDKGLWSSLTEPLSDIGRRTANKYAEHMFRLGEEPDGPLPAPVKTAARGAGAITQSLGEQFDTAFTSPLGAATIGGGAAANGLLGSSSALLNNIGRAGRATEFAGSGIVGAHGLGGMYENMGEHGTWGGLGQGAIETALGGLGMYGAATAGRTPTSNISGQSPWSAMQRRLGGGEQGLEYAGRPDVNVRDMGAFDGSFRDLGNVPPQGPARLGPARPPGLPPATRAMATTRGLPQTLGDVGPFEAGGVVQGEVLGLPSAEGLQVAPQVPARSTFQSPNLPDPRTFYFGRKGLSQNLEDVTDIAAEPKTPQESAFNALIPNRFKPGQVQSNVGSPGPFGYEPQLGGAAYPQSSLGLQASPQARTQIPKAPTTGSKTLPDSQVMQRAQLGESPAVREMSVRQRTGKSIPDPAPTDVTPSGLATTSPILPQRQPPVGGARILPKAPTPAPQSLAPQGLGAISAEPVGATPAIPEIPATPQAVAPTPKAPRVKAPKGAPVGPGSPEVTELADRLKAVLERNKAQGKSPAPKKSAPVKSNKLDVLTAPEVTKVKPEKPLPQGTTKGRIPEGQDATVYADFTDAEVIKIARKMNQTALQEVARRNLMEYIPGAKRKGQPKSTANEMVRSEKRVPERFDPETSAGAEFGQMTRFGEGGEAQEGRVLDLTKRLSVEDERLITEALGTNEWGMHDLKDPKIRARLPYNSYRELDRGGKIWTKGKPVEETPTPSGIAIARRRTGGRPAELRGYKSLYDVSEEGLAPRSKADDRSMRMEMIQEPGSGSKEGGAATKKARSAERIEKRAKSPWDVEDIEELPKAKEPTPLKWGEDPVAKSRAKPVSSFKGRRAARKEEMRLARVEARKENHPFEHRLQDWKAEQLEMGHTQNEIDRAVKFATREGIDPTLSDDLNDLGYHYDWMRQIKKEGPGSSEYDELLGHGFGNQPIKDWYDKTYRRVKKAVSESGFSFGSDVKGRPTMTSGFDPIEGARTIYGAAKSGWESAREAYKAGSAEAKRVYAKTATSRAAAGKKIPTPVKGYAKAASQTGKVFAKESPKGWREVGMSGLTQLEKMGPTGKRLAQVIQRSRIYEEQLSAKYEKQLKDSGTHSETAVQDAIARARRETWNHTFGEKWENLDELLKTIPEADRDRASNIVNKYFGRLRNPAKGTNKFAKAVSEVEAATKLSQFFISNMANVAMTGMRGNIKPLLKAGKKMITDYHGAVAEAHETGALQPILAELNRELGIGEVAGKGKKYSIGKIFGIEKGEEIQRVFASVTGKGTAEELFTQVKSGKGDVSTAKKRLSELLLQDDLSAIMKQGKLSKDQLNFAGNRMSEITQGRASSIDLPPLWSSHPMTNLAFQFKRFAFTQSKNIKQAIKTDPKRAAVMLSVGMPVIGEGISYVKDAVNSVGHALTSDQSLKEAFEELRDKRGTGLNRLADDYANAWAFGLVLDLARSFGRGESGFTDFAAGPFYGDIAKIGSSIYQGNTSKLKRQTTEMIPFVGRGLAGGMAPDN